MSSEVTLLYAKGDGTENQVSEGAVSNVDEKADADTKSDTKSEDGNVKDSGGAEEDVEKDNDVDEDGDGDEDATEEIRFTITNLDTGEKVKINDWESYYTSKFDTFCQGTDQEDDADLMKDDGAEQGEDGAQGAEAEQTDETKPKPKPRSPSRAETQMSIDTPACSMWGFAFKNGPACVSDRNAAMSEVRGEGDEEEEGVKRKAGRSGGEQKSNYWKFLFGTGDGDGATNKLNTEDDAGAGGGEDGVGAVSISIDDFELLQVLGRGGYGKVMLVQRKLDGELFAVKMIRKAQMTWQDRRNCVIERSILAMNNHPFISRYPSPHHSSPSPSFALAILRPRHPSPSPSFALAILRPHHPSPSPSFALTIPPVTPSLTPLLLASSCCTLLACILLLHPSSTAYASRSRRPTDCISAWIFSTEATSTGI
jgi:hypothetical protein